jgi:DsbC/DsbD-like thiol-disulfide interchange protein
LSGDTSWIVQTEEFMRYRIMCLLVFISCIPAVSRAEVIKSTVSVHAGVNGAKAGSTFPVAILIEVPDGWYTYAADPGDAGMPPDIRMHAPEGVIIGQWRFPPHQTITDAAGTYYGYTNRVVLLSEITLPEDIPEGAALRAVFDVLWMICKGMCLPFMDKVTLALPLVSPETEIIQAGGWNKLLRSGGWQVEEEKTAGDVSRLNKEEEDE